MLCVAVCQSMFADGGGLCPKSGTMEGRIVATAMRPFAAGAAKNLRSGPEFWRLRVVVDLVSALWNCGVQGSGLCLDMD